MNPFMPKIFEFLIREWNCSEIEDNKNLILRSKILNILCESLIKQELKSEYTSFYLTVMTSSLIINQTSEIYLIEVRSIKTNK